MDAVHRFEDLHATAASISVDEDRAPPDQKTSAARCLHPLHMIGAPQNTARTSASSATVSPPSGRLSARPIYSNVIRSTKAMSTSTHVNEDQVRENGKAVAEPVKQLAQAGVVEQMPDVTCQNLEDRICNAVRAAVHQVMLEATAQLRATAAELQRQHAQCCRDIAGGQVADWRADLREVLEEFRNKLKCETFGPPPNDGEKGAATPSRWPRRASPRRDSLQKPESQDSRAASPQRDSLPKPESRDSRESSSPERLRAATGDACTEEEIHWLVNNLSRKRTTSEEFKSRVVVNAPESMTASSSSVSASVQRRSGCSPVDDSQKKSWPGIPEALAARRAFVAAPPPLSRSQTAIPASKGRLSLNLSSSTPPLSAFSATPPLAGQRLGGSLQSTARQQLR